MAKLADALDLGSSVRKDVWVQVPPSAPKKKDPIFSGLFCLEQLPQRTCFDHCKLGVDYSKSTTSANRTA